MVKSYQGSASPRSTPKTSHAAASSNSGVPSATARATEDMSETVRGTSLRTLAVPDRVSDAEHHQRASRGPGRRGPHGQFRHSRAPAAGHDADPLRSRH